MVESEVESRVESEVKSPVEFGRVELVVDAVESLVSR